MYFVMENVTGIAGKRGKTILQQLIEDVEKIGYKVHVDLLDAQDYGVPQRRKRYIIVGERNDLGKHYKYPEPVATRHTVRDTIEIFRLLLQTEPIIRKYHSTEETSYPN